MNTIKESVPELASGSERADLPLLGMHCAACANRIEKMLSKTEGVESCSVNFATTRATVIYNPAKTNPPRLREVVQKVGYDVIMPQAQSGHPQHEAGDVQDAEIAARAKEYNEQKRKFLVALVLTIPVTIMAMGGHFLPALERLFNFPGRAWIEFFLTTPVLFWTGREFFTGAWLAAKHRAADMNTLVAIGTFAAYAFSTVATVASGLFAVSPQGHAGHGNAPTGVYYEVAAIVVTLILMGRLLEARARAQTGSAIRALMGLQAKTARVERNGHEFDVPIEAVQVGDIVLVRPGEKVPVDGTVQSGHSLVSTLR